MKTYAKVRMDFESWRGEDGLIYAPTVLTDLKGYPLNPIQEEVAREHINDEANLLLTSRTGSGKTVCGNIIIYRYLRKGGKIIYTAPYKALTDEKFEAWTARDSKFRRFKAAIINSDFKWTDQQRERVAEAQIICATQESLLAALTNHRSEKNKWPIDAAMLWVDELHLITQEGRGANLETMVPALLKRVPHCRIFCTSGTLPNAEDFTAWLTNVNGRETRCIQSTYQPVPIERKYSAYNGMLKGDSDQRLEMILQRVMAKPKEQFMVVVYVKAFGYKLQEYLKQHGVKAEFHSADIVDRSERKRIENSFRRKMVRVIICTTTLTVGVNLPARNVISTQSNWGQYYIPAYEILQAVGRAGRMGIDDKGFQDVFVDSENYDEHVSRIENGEPITSTLLSDKEVLTHVNRAIYTREIINQETLLSWYRKTLAYVQIEDPIHFQRVVHKYLATLTKIKMVEQEGDEESPQYKSTARGKICAQMMLDPIHFHMLGMNFRSLKKLIHPNDFDLAKAIASCRLYEEEYPNPINNRHYHDAINRMTDPCYRRYTQAAYERLIRQPSTFLTGSASYRLLMDADRWCGAMMRAVTETGLLREVITEEELFVAFARLKSGTSYDQAKLEYNRFRPSEAKALVAQGIFSLADARKNPMLASLCISKKRLDELRIRVRK